MNKTPRSGDSGFGRCRYRPLSLKRRLQLCLAGLLVGTLSALGMAVYELQRQKRLHQIDDELQARVAGLTGALRDFDHDSPPLYDHHIHRAPGPDVEGPPEPPFHNQPPDDGPPPQFGRPDPPPPLERDFFSHATLFSTHSRSFYYTIWRPDGSLRLCSLDAPADITPPRRFERDTLPHFRITTLRREVIHCSGSGECALAGCSVEADYRAIHEFGWILFAACGAVLIIVLGIGWWLHIRSLRAIAQISVAAHRISQSMFAGPPRNALPAFADEFGELAHVLNITFADLGSAFVRQQQFTAEVAHELRAPLAAIIADTQTVLSRERSAHEYRQTVQADLDTAQRMRHITESLLELARLDASREPLQRSSVDLAEAARRCVERILPLAAKAGIPITGKYAPARVFCPPERLDQVISNILSNAVAYTPPGGHVFIATRCEGNHAVVTISDTGIGIARSDLPYIFERFYRAGKSLARTLEHSGLGLAISKAIIDAENGTIDVISKPAAGSTFTVRLPASN